MKHFATALLIVLGTVLTTSVNAKTFKQIQSPVTGRIIDSEGAPVAYATVVALQKGVQADGTVTDDNGAFSLPLRDGEYTLSFEFIGCKTEIREIRLDGPLDIGVITLEESDIRIGKVEVTAQIIRREADRFVVDVANMPAAIGKDGVEILQTSPGVFINDDKITVNGKTGTKVYVNEREIRYTGDQLLSYLRGLKTEEIQKIEVVPVSGADYDADSSGGIIKITLRQRRDDGLMGSVTLRSNINDMLQLVSPSANIDYRNGKWTLSASGYYNYSRNRFTSEEVTRYPMNDNSITATSDLPQPSQWYRAKAGAICEINSRHSTGVEVEYNGSREKSPNNTSSQLTDPLQQLTETSIGRYSGKGRSHNITARFNYIAKLDTLGSVLKVLADYTNQKSSSGNDYTTEKITEIAGISHMRDSIYRDRSGTDYNIATVSIACEKVFSPKFTLKTGAKYTYNLMESFSVYDHLQNDAWITRPDYNYDVNYTENIAALYAIAAARLGRWGITAGLRGEYTNTSGHNNIARQNYFSLFPNANISFGLTKDYSYMLVGQYARNIRRPNFWALNPARSQVSEYTYQTGNPDLAPSFYDQITLSAVLKYKYTISFAATFARDEIQQVALTDPDDPNINYIGQENLDRVDGYFLTANLPFQFTRWWSANINLTGGYQGTRIRKGEAQVFHPLLNWSLSTTFTLPLQFYISIDYFGMAKTYISNISMGGINSMSASVKKRLLDDKLTLSAGVRNIIPMNNRISYKDAGFTRSITIKQGWSRPAFIFSASYNFNSGKKFNVRKIESDADESRLAK
ncbi:MAG: TonB-dependent receptor family protein [Alistipes sp.]|nr:TonB-dependent receptor family protein [Alistipes sp.]